MHASSGRRFGPAAICSIRSQFIPSDINLGGDGIGARTLVTRTRTIRGYDHCAVEAKWQAYWAAHDTFRTLDDPALPKYYVLDMFPYPSGEGLHVGHPLGYVATDVVARAKRMQGCDVLHPMGWDAFGLPTERHALATGQHPRAITARNTARFRSQLQALGLSYDWSRELDTSSPAYTRWTQWLFLKLYERGLAYQAELPVNWCPALGTVLADEEVIDGRSERGDHPVERRTMRQWVLKITAYAERLLADLDELDWPAGVVAMQRHWIGRSEGAEVRFALVGPDGMEAPSPEVMVKSQFLDGCSVPEARARMIAWLEAHRCGRRKVTYRLRDWLFSRQRFWGEPFPVLHFEDGSVRPLDDDELPLLLPEVDDIRPRGEGETPLASVPEWSLVVDAKTGRPARRDPNTMPQWAGSCWYYLRFLDPHDDRAPWDMAKEARWLPVDLYVGGAEHAVLHLLYARFWHKVFYDIGLVSTKEPFRRLVNQGMVLGENGEKMSKSRGNVVNPDAIVESHGADALRIFELFMGPIEATKPWSTAGLYGARRFLDRVWRLYVDPDGGLSRRIAVDKVGGGGARGRPEAGGMPSGRAADGGAVEPGVAFARLTNQTIRKVSEDIESLRFNTAIAQLMQWLNAAYAEPVIPQQAAERFVLLFAPFAPHLAEELWQRLGHPGSLARALWPEPEPEGPVETEVEIAVQVDGRLRDRLRLPAGASDEVVQRAALTSAKVVEAMGGRVAERVVVVPDRLCNVVTRSYGAAR